jgi:hypothetical protein
MFSIIPSYPFLPCCSFLILRRLLFRQTTALAGAGMGHLSGK